MRSKRSTHMKRTICRASSFFPGQAMISGLLRRSQFPMNYGKNSQSLTGRRNQIFRFNKKLISSNVCLLIKQKAFPSRKRFFSLILFRQQESPVSNGLLRQPKQLFFLCFKFLGSQNSHVEQLFILKDRFNGNGGGYGVG